MLRRQAAAPRDDLPELARRYLRHSVRDRATDYDAVIVDMQGRIRLKDKWLDFTSTLEVEALSAFSWSASIHRGLMRFSGHDQYKGGHGEMLWRLYGLLPVMKSDDENISHSARGRAALEQTFLPSALARAEVTWLDTTDGWVQASWVLDGERVAIDLDVAEDGALRAVRMQRWSDADGTPWHFVTFGADVKAEASFSGLVIPTEISAGWFYGEPRFDEDGRFFEGHVTGLRPR